MSGSSKKNKKKAGSSTGGGASKFTEGFDYSKLIPEGLDLRTRNVIERFFRNEDLAPEEKGEAMDKFVEAIRNEYKEVERQEREAAVVDASIDDILRRSTPSPIYGPSDQRYFQDRERINVGWMTRRTDCGDEVDTKIALFCQRLGEQMYNFVSYPLGGLARSYWYPTRDESGRYAPPSLWLPDVQLHNHLWETYVHGHISLWIDCDAEEEDFAKTSAEELVKELNYAVYLGIRSVSITLRRMDNPKLAEVINKWLWTRQCHTAIWIFVPSAFDFFEEQVEGKECWEVWADFRRQCSNFGSHRLNVGLYLYDQLDDEFLDERKIDRWLAEPLGAFCVDSRAFMMSAYNHQACMSLRHEALFHRLWTTDNLRVLVRGSPNNETEDSLKLQYANFIRLTVRDSARNQPHISADLQNLNYFDVLQTPLQPLADNLDSGVYNTFEQDSIKYQSYQNAIFACLVDLCDRREKLQTLVLYVLGAGRGPLMTAAIKAEAQFNEQYRSRKNRLKMQLYVVEKNPNALVTLNFVNGTVWKGRVTVIEGDMRKLNENKVFLDCPKPDIVVSELLGSFGDNELSPECLDGITFFLKPTTISIPQSYTSFAAPIMSCQLHQNIRSATRSYYVKGVPGVGRESTLREKDGSYTLVHNTNMVEANMDQLYVVYLRHYCSLDSAKPVFLFKHPNFDNSSNEREARITFDNFDMPSELMGFAGYFQLLLYGDIMISIEPSTHTVDMYSWFSAVLPLREMERINPGDKVTLDIKRKVDVGGVWYEWFVDIEGENGEKRQTVLQNPNGVNNYLRFFD